MKKKLKIFNAESAKELLKLNKKDDYDVLIHLAVMVAINDFKRKTWIGFVNEYDALKHKEKLDKKRYKCRVEYVGYDGMQKDYCAYRLHIKW